MSHESALDEQRQPQPLLAKRTGPQLLISPTWWISGYGRRR